MDKQDEKRMEELRDWIKKEVDKTEKEIDRGGPFHYLEARKEALLEVLNLVNSI